MTTDRKRCLRGKKYGFGNLIMAADRKRCLQGEEDGFGNLIMATDKYTWLWERNMASET